MDYLLLQTGPVSAYADHDALSRDIAALEERGYRVERFACERWSDEEDLHDEFARRFSFPDYYGRNWPALDECMADADVLQVPGRGGLCIVLDRLDTWPEGQDVLLRVLANAAWYWLLLGRRLITLVLVGSSSWNGPADLGATTADWRH